MSYSRRGETVLALYPTTRGLGFVVTRTPLSPIDWGTRMVKSRNKNVVCLRHVAALIDANQPDAIVMEDPTAPGSLRSNRIRRLVRSIASLAETQTIDVHVFPRSRVMECFERYGAKSRYETAVAISKQISALERFLPSRRRRWQTDSPRLCIFNAAALAMTYFATSSQ
jgi:hypothetical protein